MGNGTSSYARERSSSGTNSCRGTAVIAASTPASLMPRRRNCFSIISARCAAYSFFSSMRNRHGMFFPRACFQDLFHLREGKVAFILSIVEVWRDARTGFGAVVDDDVSGEEFAANLVGMRAFDRNRPRALRGIFRRVHAPPRTRAPSIRRVVMRMDFSRIAPMPALLTISSPGWHA